MSDYDEFTKRMTSFDLTLDPDGEALKQSESSEFDDVLEHYGVKGMKWGVRRTPEQLGRARAARKAKRAAAKQQKQSDRSRSTSSDAAQAQEARRIAKNAGTDKLSNQDLQHLVNRMKLESQYNQLSSSQKSFGGAFAESFFDLKVQDFSKNPPAAQAGSIIGSLLRGRPKDD